MQKYPALKALVEQVKQKLGRDFDRWIERTAEPVEAAGYDRAFAGLTRSLGELQERIRRNQERVRARYLDLPDQPPGRQRTVLDNSAPQMLAALSVALMRRSYRQRFGSVTRSLELAALAVEAADRVAGTEYLSRESAADLQAEALAHRANAERLNSRYRAAHRTLAAAERLRAAGTGDRHLKATLLHFRSALHDAEGRVDKAARLLDREIAVRRLLGNDHELGQALIDRGRTAIWTGSLPEASRYLREGVLRVGDPQLMLLALLPLAEALARDCQGILALEVSCQANSIIVMLGEKGQVLRRHTWIKALAYRALGEWRGAEAMLLRVREAFATEGLGHLAGLVSLDLACVWAAQGRVQDLKRLAEEVHAIFLAEGVEERARAAFLIWLQAVRAERLSEELALRVANFFVRSQRDRRLRPDR